MNTVIKIEKARVVRKGELQSGVFQKSPEESINWQKMNVKVEWEYTFNDKDGQPQTGKQTAVVAFRNEWAVWCKDNVSSGSYDNAPNSYLDIWIRMDGRFDVKPKKDGSGYWEDVTNQLNVVFAQIVQP